MVIVVDTQFYNTIKEKRHLIDQIKKKFKKVKFSFTENLIIYQYDDGIRQ
ncbi:hypothetical protein AB0Y20_01200 [Heyndrickxia oleronia]